jgi:hypothetical protein
MKFHLTYGFNGANCSIVRAVEINTNVYTLFNDFHEEMFVCYGWYELFARLKDLEAGRYA